MIDRGYRTFDCLDCGKRVREPRGFTGFHVTNDDMKEQRVEIEYHDYCKKCGNKRIKEYKQKTRLQNLLASEIVPQDFVTGFLQGNISKKIFWEKVNEAERLSRKKQVVRKHLSPSQLRRLERRKKERILCSRYEHQKEVNN